MIRRLITDEDVRLGRVASPLVLDEGTLLTPAARDRALLLGYVIVERGALPPDPRSAAATPPSGAAAEASAGPAHPAAGGPCGASGSAGAATAGWPSALPADGLYLLRVEGGRVASVLPAAGPGLSIPAATPPARPAPPA